MYKLFLLLLLLTGISSAQQVSDPDFNPPVPSPVYSPGKGSQIYIDEAHNNFHTMEGRYKPFADLLIKDGYVVKPLRDTIVENTLEGAAILVISNALNINSGEWALPVLSAFTENEIDRIAEWVNKGGSLFLIADHMPFGGAASELAGRFGFKLNNGFAIDTVTGRGPDLFTRTAGTLKDNLITNGRNDSEKVDSIYSFTGEAFNIPEDAVPVMILNENFISLMPDTAWNFKKDTPKISVAGWCQGAVRKYGKGRVAVWGEAAMFSAQLAGENKTKAGMNAPYAKHNYQLLLNIIHWLDGKLE